MALLQTADGPWVRGAPRRVADDLSVQRHRRPLLRSPRGGVGWSAVAAAAVLVVFAIGGWRRRWMADDGLIVLRTVRNLLAGNGPVFNVGERVESNTSTLWTYLLAAVGWVPAPLEWVTVLVCLALSVAGLGMGLLAAGHLHPGTRLLLPLGALVYVALPPARDFATSGLETGLVLAWAGLLALLLARRAARGRTGGELGIAVVAGLAPLVRPELAIVGGLAGLLLLAAPLGWRRRVTLVVVAAAVPLGYQVFRMAYYGLPYPVTAVAKEATSTQWEQGLIYLRDLTEPYLLRSVLAVVAVLGVGAALRARRRVGTEAGRAVHWSLRRGPVVAVLLASGGLYVLYVLRVGGDFMHGRTLLPGLFLLLLPVLAVPLPRWGLGRVGLVGSAVAASAVAGWAVAVLGSPGPGYGANVTAAGIVDERSFYLEHSGVKHPILAQDYRGNPELRGLWEALDALDGRGALIFPGATASEPWNAVPTTDPAAPVSVLFRNMGMTAMNVDLDVRVIDNVGLTNPVAAHTPPLPDTRIGHAKAIPQGWEAARVGTVGRPEVLNPATVTSAELALDCTPIAEMVDSYTAPLTIERAGQNVRGAFARAALRYPTSPGAAALQCVGR